MCQDFMKSYEKEIQSIMVGSFHWNKNKTILHYAPVEIHYPSNQTIKHNNTKHTGSSKEAMH